MSESAASKSKSTSQPPASAAESAGTESVPATSAGLPPTAQVLFAVINGGNGTVVRSLGVTSAARLAVGMYQVIFSHDVTGSAYVGTIGLPGSDGASPAGEIAVVGRSGVANGVFVQTFNSAGAYADRSFHLAVLS
ncbi:hypothetical protein BDK92_4851 [Micromonospora pisi]|uniref:Uncharacterized protein n=1 Tax=Micromonospora pisi TaxID=589240 RepID=A0A495JPM9_9ACTN|nr:hypothetical protein [Micromonospora pisi]RKR90478.1 hypothetical protein BDK92_4851 [Micromonospora pisi]